MAKKVRDQQLDTRDARAKLKPRGKPYWRTLERGLHIGYRRLRGKPGTWWARHYLGSQTYDVEAIGAADDLSDADGTAILDFWQAQTEARARMVARAQATAGKHGPLTVKDAVEAYIEFLDSNRKSVIDVRYRANAFIYPALGNVECGNLTTDMLHKWHIGLSKVPPRKRTKPGEDQQHRAFSGDEESIRRRRSTANRVLTVLKGALNRAWRQGKVSSDSAWRRLEPFKSVDAARIRYLTVAEAKRLINGCDPEFRSLAQAALQTGARYGELTRLEVQDFNRDAGTLTIRQSKSGKPRHVVLTDEGIALFSQLSAGRAGHELLLQKTNGEPWRTSHQGRPMRLACGHAKITPPINFHGLRHTWASLAAMAGMPLMVVARNLGHADTRMVEKHYGHLAASYVADAIREHAPKFGFTPDKKIAAMTSRV